MQREQQWHLITMYNSNYQRRKHISQAEIQSHGKVPMCPKTVQWYALQEENRFETVALSSSRFTHCNYTPLSNESHGHEERFALPSYVTEFNAQKCSVKPFRESAYSRIVSNAYPIASLGHTSSLDVQLCQNAFLDHQPFPKQPDQPVAGQGRQENPSPYAANQYRYRADNRPWQPCQVDKQIIIDSLVDGRTGRTTVTTADCSTTTPFACKRNIPDGLKPNHAHSKNKIFPYGLSVELIGINPAYVGQILAALAVSLGPFAAGLGKGYSSPAIASLQQRDADAFSLNGQQASWLASLSMLGALFGAPVGGAAMRWGRRSTLIAAGCPLSACWIATVFAVSVEVMCVAAFLSGFLVAVIQLAAQVYVSEISAPNIRGGLSALSKVAGHAGFLIAFAAGAFLDWRQLAAMIALAPAIMSLTMWRMPESPGYLMLKGKDEEAESSLRWLRGPDADLRLELGALHAHVLSRAAMDLNPDLLFQTLRKPAMIACGLMFFQRFSGANAFNFYVVSVLKQTFGGTNPHSAAVAVAVVQLLSSLLSGLLVDRAGRLPLLVASSVLMILALASFGSFAYYEESSSTKPSSQLDWIPLLCVLIFTAAFSLGISPISWLLVSELFTLEHRGLGTALATAFSYLCAFVGVKTFVDFQELLGLDGAFWLYAAISICGLWFVICCVPETKGRDLQDMDDTVR